MAATKQKIFVICPQCKDIKEVPDPKWYPANPQGTPPPHPVIVCPTCLGEGHIEFGYLLVPGP